MKKLNRAVALVLALIMILSAMPLAYAESTYTSSTLVDGTLTVSGTGEMTEIFTHDETVKKVIIESGVTGIGDYAFAYCTSLESVVIPDTVTSIGASAFKCCESLKSIHLPDSLEKIGEYAFESCAITSIIIPESVKTLSSGIFYKCYDLQSAKLPENITAIPSYLFSFCYMLERIDFPDSVKAIGRSAFENTSITSITIPDGVKVISNRAFSYCYRLKEVVIPNSVTVIESSAFIGCSRLKSINLPASLKYLGDSAFWNCNLKEVVIPSGITGINSSVFIQNRNLIKLYIPASVTMINGEIAELTAVIFGETGSYAEEYASANGYNFISTSESALNLDKTEYSGEIGEQFTLTPSHILEQVFTWESSNTDVASVENGTVTLNGIGVAVITVTAGNGDTAKCLVSVNPSYITLTLDTPVTVVAQPDTEVAQPQFKFVPETNGFYYFYSVGEYDTIGYLYDSDMYSIVESDNYNDINFRVDSELQAGETYYLKSETRNVQTAGEYTVCVSKVPSVESIVIFDDNINGLVGSSRYIHYSVSPEGAHMNSVTWTSSDPDVATVKGGYVSFLAEGTATITATCENGNFDSVEITVAETKYISLDTPVTATIDTQNGFQTYKFSTITEGFYTISFSAENPVVVNVNNDYGGYVESYTGKEYDFITFLNANSDYYISVRFMNPDLLGTATLDIQKTSYIDIVQEKIYNLSSDKVFKFVPSESGSYIFKSTGNVDTVGQVYDMYMNQIRYDDDSGEYSNFKIIVELVAGETYYLKSSPYAGQSGVEYSVSITKAVLPTGIKIQNPNSTYYVNDVYFFDAYFIPSNAFEEDYTWSSSNTEIINIDASEGRAEMLSVGTATITVTSDSGFTDSVEITVEEPESVVVKQTYSGEINNDIKKYKFIPQTDGSYKFDVSITGDTENACFSIYGNTEGYTNKPESSLVYYLEADTVYYIEIFAEGESEYSFVASKTDDSEFNYIISNESVLIKDYHGDINAVIPEKIGGYPVREIHSFAFANIGIESITLPDTLTNIYEYAFFECTSLTDVYYKGTQEQFSNIHIETECNDTFLNATVHYVETSSVITGQAGANATYSFDTETGVLTLSGTGTLWSGIPSADENAPYREQVTEIIVESGITGIGGNVFGNGKYPNVTKVTLPAGVTSIGASAFHNCTKLREINIPEGVKTIGEWAFYACNRLSSITFPASLTNIGENAFYGVYIKNFNYNSVRTDWDKVTVSETGNERLAFTVCTDDTAEILPTGDTILIFNESSETLYISGTMYTGDFVNGSGTYLVNNEIAPKVKHIVLDRTIAGFGSYNFVNLTNLETVTGGENMRFLGIWAFKGLTKLKTVEFLSKDRFGVISYGAFADCTSLTNVTLSNSIVTLGGAAFRNCTSLTSIVVPSKIQGIGDNTFFGCTSLETVEILGAKAIRQQAFAGCTGIRTITLPDGFTTIDEWAFSSPTGVARIGTINIPASLTTVNAHAFYWVNVTTVNYAGSAEDWAKITVADNNRWLTQATINFGA